MKEHTPLKILNKEATIMGLNITDTISIVALYTVLNSIFLRFNFEILALPISLFFSLTLIPIRLNFRRHIIRDYLTRFFIMYFKNGVYYDPKTHRSETYK